MFVSAIIAAAGRGTRLGASVPKQLLPLGDRSILQRSFELVESHQRIDEIVVALPHDIAADPPAFLHSAAKPVRIVYGGARRQDSVANAFNQTSARADVVVIHDAARPFASPHLFSAVIDAAAASGAAIAALGASDTVKESGVVDGRRMVVRTIARDAVYLAQTPQAFTRDVLAKAIALGNAAGGTATDEASLAELAGYPVQLVDGESTNLKITTEHDLRVSASSLASPQILVPRIGLGYDLHRLEAGRRLMIGGVEIPYDRGLVGHSDADVLCHAVTDALLGAASLGDIGRHFPDTDAKWKDADSILLLRRSAEVVRAAGFSIVNVDAVVIVERPKLQPYVDAIRARLAGAMDVDVALVSVKGKTNEKVGPLGANEAIAVHAVALVVSARP